MRLLLLLLIRRCSCSSLSFRVFARRTLYFDRPPSSLLSFAARY